MLRRPAIGPASPRVPAGPREASPRVQKVGLVPALLWSKGQQTPSLSVSVPGLPAFLVIKMEKGENILDDPSGPS